MPRQSFSKSKQERENGFEDALVIYDQDHYSVYRSTIAIVPPFLPTLFEMLLLPTLQTRRS
jgi:hypothetical protein